MALQYNPATPILQGRNIRPPLGSFFNGEAYRLFLFPEMNNPNRSVLVIRMILQFQFSSGDGGSWTQTEKQSFAANFVSAIKSVWDEKARITTTSDVPSQNCRDVGVVFELCYFIDGWHISDDFEIGVEKIRSDSYPVSSCAYSLGNTHLDSEDLRAVMKQGGTVPQRDAVHEFGHMLGLRDEYPQAADNPHHVADTLSIMNTGETVRERHYAPFAGWLTQQYATAAHLTRSRIDYKVNGRIDMSNAQL